MRYTLFSIAAFSIIAFTYSCGSKNKFVKSIDELAFYDDSVIFDTVFTDVGSATEVFIVYNRGNENILLDEVFMAGRKASPYRLNFDGIAGTSHKDVEILAGDSLYGFIEVTIDPNDETMPFVVKDSVVFKSEDRQTDLKVISWGRNAIFHLEDTIVVDETWDISAPHLIYGELIVADGATLTISEGTEVFCHNRSRINIFPESRLNVLGTAESKVIFQGDRKEKRYEDLPGQWIGIHFHPGAEQSTIRHAIIKNGSVGVRSDLFLAPDKPTVFLENTTITTMNDVCVLGYTANIQAINCEFTNSCQYLVVGEFGGYYNFVYCTMGNFQKNCVRTTPSFYMSNADYTDPDDVVTINDLSMNLFNTIIYGSETEEIGFNQSGQGSFGIGMGNNLIRTELTDQFGLATLNNILNEDPKFVQPGILDYTLDTLSAAIGKAVVLDGVKTDYFDKPRDATKPDIGAFEREE